MEARAFDLAGGDVRRPRRAPGGRRSMRSPPRSRGSFPRGRSGALLDVGAGTGELGERLAERVRRATSASTSRGPCCGVLRRFAEPRRTALRAPALVQADAAASLAIPGAKSFDVVFASRAFHRLPLRSRGRRGAPRRRIRAGRFSRRRFEEILRAPQCRPAPPPARGALRAARALLPATRAVQLAGSPSTRA